MSAGKGTSFHPPTALFQSLEEKRDLEARNALIQFDAVLGLADSWSGDKAMRLTPDILAHLQRLAVQDIYACAGRFRNGPVSINGTLHRPPPHEEVPGLVAELCDYANSRSDPVHVASYLLWRHNWIHPFFGGNGRTSRAISYLALCALFGFRLPGSMTIPDLIVADRQPYYAALDLADAVWKEERRLDVSQMERLLGDLLAKQLHSQAV